MMSDQADVGGLEQREVIAVDAYMAAAAEVTRIARQTGADIRTRKIWPGAASDIDYAEAGAGLRIARALELAAGRTVRDYIRYAREDGLGWQEIGAALDLGAEVAERGLSVAEAAFGFAAGPAAARGDTPTFRWTCHACGLMISDRGPGPGHSEDDEPGHAERCARLAAAVAEHDATWTQDG